MADEQVPERFASKLLRQDESLHTPRYKEHRMQLEHQLARAESRERIAKRVVIGALLAAAAAFPVLASSVFGSPDPFDRDATVLSVTFGAIYVASWAIFFVGVASYYSRFLPRVRQAREDVRDESIRELRREISDLRQRLNNTPGQNGPPEERGPSPG